MLAINAVQILREQHDEDGLQLRSKEVPEGWRETWSSEDSRIWERVGSPIRTGGVVSTEDATVKVVDQSNSRVVLEVQEVGADGGEAVLSRLAWPGYTVSGSASIGEPLRDYLLRIDLPAGTQNETVVLEFRPPGWSLVVISLILSINGAIFWSVVASLRRKKRSSGPALSSANHAERLGGSGSSTS